jgi:hypothetical protein
VLQRDPRAARDRLEAHLDLGRLGRQVRAPELEHESRAGLPHEHAAHLVPLAAGLVNH